METLTFDGNVVTPSGTPLGGWVHLEVSDDGSYKVKFHMHSSSVLGSFDFNVRAYLSAPGCPTMAFIQSGHVSGVDSWEPPAEPGTNPLLALYWGKLKAGPPSFTVAKDYKWGGVVGTIEDLVKDIFDIGAGAIGDTLGVIIGATQEAIGLLGTTLGPGGTIGVIGGVVVFAIGAIAGPGVGGALIFALVAGAAIGANAVIQSRPLNDAEIALAREVFGETIPYGNVMITNLGGLSGRGFTAPGVDRKTYCNLGKAFDDPLGRHPPSYPYPGQLLIHELTHAWQIAHTGSLPGLMCSGLVNQTNFLFGDNVYEYGPPGPDWSSQLNAEQQGAIVDQWFAGNGHSAGYFPMDQENVYYRYIWENILARVPSSFAPGNLRTSPSFAVARAPNHLDVFWVGPDGAIGTQWWVGAPGLNWGDHQPFAITPPAQAGSDEVAAASRTPNHLDVFWVGPDGAIATQWADDAPSLSWGDHQPFTITPPGAAAGSRLAAVDRTPNNLDVFWVRPDGAIGTQWWVGKPGLNWGDHQPFTITPPGAAMTKFPIAIDARLLFFRTFFIPGVTGEPIDAQGRVQTFELAPGDYSYFVVELSFTFTVTPRGTVDYDHSCDAFLRGRGTATLQLLGFEVTLDAVSLTGADNGGGVWLAIPGSTNDDWIARKTVRLLPQEQYFVEQGGIVALEFALQRDGRFSYRPELDTAQGGCLAGAGTTTLTFKGHTVSVDASAVSHFLLIHFIRGAKPAQNGKITVVVLPADGFILQLDSGVTDLKFSVGTTGTVTLDPAMTGRLEVVPASPPIVRVLPD
jgi:hypothetical protein